jgi:hypothetical protein
MATFLAKKSPFGALHAVDAHGEAALAKIAKGDVVNVDVRRPRNIQHHRMFWALMSIVHDNIDHERYPTVEDLVAAVKIAAGLRTRIELPSGEIGFIPGSIAFHKMNQIEFAAFYERVCDLIAAHFLPGVDKEDLRKEVETMIGVAA